jgi:hypothetical protein
MYIATYITQPGDFQGKVINVRSADQNIDFKIENMSYSTIEVPNALTNQQLVKAWVNLETLELYFKELETPA